MDRKVCYWTIEDVHQAAENLEVTLDADQANQVLDMMEARFDASIGMNWELVEGYVTEVMKGA